MMPASTERTGWPRALALAVAVAAGGCASTQPQLARDWTETNALVALRAERGGYLQAGHELMRRGEPDLALRGYTRAIAETGLGGPVIGGMGAANLQLGRLGQARDLLERGTRVAPQSPSVWNNLGVALVLAGETQAAREAIGLADALAGGDAPMAANLAQLQGEEIPAAPASVFLSVRHRSGLYLLLEGPGAGEDVGGHDAE